MRNFILSIVSIAICSCLSRSHNESAVATTSTDIWRQYVGDPDTHSNLPNCSYAGYRNSEIELPNPRVVANISTWAAGDGSTDDTAAFAAAISFAKQNGGGSILIPEGRYRLTGMVHVDASNIVLRGEGIGKTILAFENPLANVLGARDGGNGDRSSEYSWLGGLVHFGAAQDFGPNGRIATTDEFPQEWTPGQALCRITSTLERGAKTLSCPGAQQRIAARLFVFVRWKNNLSVLDEIYGSANFPWHARADSAINGERLVRRRSILWPVEVESVSGDSVVLKQPLRVPIRPGWEVELVGLGAHTSESGIENLTLSMKDHLFDAHNDEKGFNGIYFNRIINGWVRNVRLENVDNGFLGSAIKNVTVTGLEIDYTGTLPGQRQFTHHGTVLRAGSHDNLVTNFKILTRLRHGIEVESLSSGNVYVGVAL